MSPNNSWFYDLLLNQCLFLIYHRFSKVWHSSESDEGQRQKTPTWFPAQLLCFAPLGWPERSRRTCATAARRHTWELQWLGRWRAHARGKTWRGAGRGGTGVENTLADYSDHTSGGRAPIEDQRRGRYDGNFVHSSLDQGQIGLFASNLTFDLVLTVNNMSQIFENQWHIRNHRTESYSVAYNGFFSYLNTRKEVLVLGHRTTLSILMHHDTACWLSRRCP